MPTNDDDPYVVYSVQHGGWWGPGRNGYTRFLSHAGRYTRAQAMQICTDAIPGQAHREGMLQELPIRLADLIDMVGTYRKQYVTGTESWM